MNEPTKLAPLLGSSLNVESERARQTTTGGKDAKRKKRRIPRAVRELLDPDGLDARDLLGL